MLLLHAKLDVQRIVADAPGAIARLPFHCDLKRMGDAIADLSSTIWKVTFESLRILVACEQ